MQESKITSSLLPAAIQRERLWKEKTKWFAGAAAMFVVGTGVAFGSYYTQKLSYDGKNEVRAKISSVQAEASKLDKGWSDIEQRGSSDRQPSRLWLVLRSSGSRSRSA